MAGLALTDLRDDTDLGKPTTWAWWMKAVVVQAQHAERLAGHRCSNSHSVSVGCQSCAKLQSYKDEEREEKSTLWTGHHNSMAKDEDPAR